MATDSGVQNVFGYDPVVPHDETELRHILQLIDKVPLYLEKLAELSAAVQEFAKIAQPFTIDGHYKIEAMIFHAFYAELENRKFREVREEDIRAYMSRVKANLQLEGVINSRNLACEVCGENRSTDRCHIIPNKLGGTAEANNILILCPTHHRLFDRFMLSRAEYAAIDWNRKSEASQLYSDSVTLAAHEKFWNGVEAGDYCRVSQYDREHIPFVKYALTQILSLFAEKKILKRSSVQKVVAPDLREISKKIVSFLIKQKILRHHDQGADGYFLLTQPSADSIDNLALRIWQEIC